MRKKLAVIAVTVAVSLSALFGCSSDENNNADNGTTPSQNSSGTDTATTTKFDIDVNYSDKEKLAVTKNELGQYSNVIKLDDESVTISESGEYVLEGEISDGQIIVDVPDSDTGVVTLILNGVDVSCSNSAAIYVKNADKVVLSLVEDTVNTFTDGDNYTYDNEEEQEPNACIFSKDDLVISGNGTLNVTGNFNNGIATKDDLTITGGTINVKAVNNGIKGKDSVAILTADITVNAGTDGIKSDNTTDAEKGFIIIEDGYFDITSGEDGIQAETCMEINGGTFIVTTGEGATTTSWNNGDTWGRPGFDMGNTSQSTEEASIKAFKAGCDITINNGDFTINSEDDAIHTNVSVEINGGVFDIASGDDGIHADSTLVINDGEISITQCYEGIEATDITVNDGEINIVSSDDGFNAAGGNDSSSMEGRPGMNNFESSTGSLTFNGGYIYVNATGDGLDANGSLAINDGYIVVDGPANGGNGAFDYGTGCTMSGGFVIAVGYSQMAQMPSQSSVNCVMIGLSEQMSAGDKINITDANGDSVVTFTPAKSYENIVLCTSDLKTGETYTLNINDKEYTTFTIENTLTTVGNATGGMGGMGGMGGFQGNGMDGMDGNGMNGNGMDGMNGNGMGGNGMDGTGMNGGEIPTDQGNMGVQPGERPNGGRK